MSNKHYQKNSPITPQTNDNENNTFGNTPQMLEKYSNFQQFQNNTPDILNEDIVNIPKPLLTGHRYHNFVIDTPESTPSQKCGNIYNQNYTPKSVQNIGSNYFNKPIQFDENVIYNRGTERTKQADEYKLDDFNSQINDFQVDSIAYLNSSDESEEQGWDDNNYDSGSQDDSEDQAWNEEELSVTSYSVEADNLSEQIEDLNVQRNTKNVFAFLTQNENENGDQKVATKKSTPYHFDKESSLNRRKNVQFVDLINDLSPINEEGVEDSSPLHTEVQKTGLQTVGGQKLIENTPYSGKYAYQSPEELPEELKKLCKTLEDQFVTPATSKGPNAQVPTSTSIRRSLFSTTPATKTIQSVNAFKKNRESIARSFFREFNDNVCNGQLPDNLEIEWSEHKRTTAGSAHLSKKNGNVSNNQPEYTAKIMLSSKVLDTEERLRSTLCHELCHVAAWIIDHNRRPPHGPIFKKWGHAASQKFPGINVSTCHNYDIHVPHVWKCVTCFRQYRRHSKSIDTTKHCCSQCKGSLEYLGKFNVDGTPAKTQKPNAYSLFVQSNFSKVRENCEPKTPHSAVMIKLAEMWKNERENWNSQPRQG